MSNFMEIRAVGSALIRTDGQTDKMKLIGSVRDYTKALKIFLCILLQCISLHWENLRKSNHGF